MFLFRGSQLSLSFVRDFLYCLVVNKLRLVQIIKKLGARLWMSNYYILFLIASGFFPLCIELIIFHFLSFTRKGGGGTAGAVQTEGNN